VVEELNTRKSKGIVRATARMEATRVAKAPLCRDFLMNPSVTVISEAPTEANSAGLLF
jgi:chorismate synthase